MGRISALPSSRISRTALNQKHYRANKVLPLFEELRSIIGKTVGRQELLRAALNPLADRISLAIVYGSVAKGREKAMSNVDLLIGTDELTLKSIGSSRHLVRISGKLSRLTAALRFNLKGGSSEMDHLSV